MSKQQDSRKGNAIAARHAATRTSSTVHAVVLALSAGILFTLCAAAPPCRAQVPLTGAVDLALQNSPRLKSAENDVKRAQAGLAVLKDIYIPSVVIGGGVGETHGITLTVPTIFSVNAQSLVFSFQQRAYIRAARSDLQAAILAQAEARNQVVEDAAVTYISLANAQQVVATLADQYGFATRLVSIVQDRVNAKLDSELELKKARRGALQVRLQEMQAQDELESTRSHLAQLTGLAADRLVALPETIPATPVAASAPGALNASASDSPGVLAAEASAKAKQQRARGDAQYTWKPLISFGAQYGRISPINDVSSFYNLQGNYNTANAGIQIQFPLVDRVRHAAAQASLLDSDRAALDLEGLRFDQAQGRIRLQRSLPELAAKAELADLDCSIAQDELKSVELQLHASAGGPPLTPKEEQTSRMQERQRYLDLLDARLQLLKAQVSLLRQAGTLFAWTQSSPAPTESPPSDH